MRVKSIAVVGAAAVCVAAKVGWDYWHSPGRLASIIATAIASRDFGIVYDLSTEAHLAEPDYTRQQFQGLMNALTSRFGPAMEGIDGPRDVTQDQKHERRHRDYEVRFLGIVGADKAPARMQIPMLHSPDGWIVDESAIVVTLERNLGGEPAAVKRAALVSAMEQSAIDRIVDNPKGIYFDRESLSEATDETVAAIWKHMSEPPAFRW